MQLGLSWELLVEDGPVGPESMLIFLVGVYVQGDRGVTAPLGIRLDQPDRESGYGGHSRIEE